MGRGSKYNDRAEHFVKLNLQSFGGTDYFLAVGNNGKFYILTTEPTDNTAVEAGTLVGGQT